MAAARALRLAFFGTPDFAVPSLERLIAGRHEVVAIVSQPDRGRGRGRRASPSPVSSVALREGIALIRPERVGDRVVLDELHELEPDLGVVVAFGQFLPKPIRECPSLGFLINGHASLLPSYRGAAPIAACILEGESRTGISVMRVEREMDAGPVALSREIPIGESENCGELTQRLSLLASDALEEAIEQIAEDRVVWTPQDSDKATFAPRIERDDAKLDWNQPAERLVRRVRAMAPTPAAFATLGDETLRILAANVQPGACRLPPGTTGNVDSEAPSIRIATSDGWLIPLVVQRSGKKPMDTAAFLRGRPISDGARFD